MQKSVKTHWRTLCFWCVPWYSCSTIHYLVYSHALYCRQSCADIINYVHIFLCCWFEKRSLPFDRLAFISDWLLQFPSVSLQPCFAHIKHHASSSPQAGSFWKFLNVIRKLLVSTLLASLFQLAGIHCFQSVKSPHCLNSKPSYLLTAHVLLVCIFPTPPHPTHFFRKLKMWDFCEHMLF